MADLLITALIPGAAGYFIAILLCIPALLAD